MNRQVHTVDYLVGRRVRLLRLERGMSQADLARGLGLSFQQVQKYERGVNRISASKLFEISEALRVDVADLFADVTAASARKRPKDHDEPAPTRIDGQIASKLSRLRDARLKQRILDLLTAIDEAPPEHRSAS